MISRVVIVGKPNVGKSQLFNRLVGERHSVVVDKPGTTRDRITLKVTWKNFEFFLTDTGGYTLYDYSFQKEVNHQTSIALSNSDLLLFLVSYKDGIDKDDRYLAKVLKKNKLSNVIVVVNKIDFSDQKYINECELGFGSGIYVSAEHGINTGVLLDSIVSKLSTKIISNNFVDRTKLAIIGRPNVGKSSLINAILNEERIIVSNTPGTTRDAIDLDFDYLGRSYTFIDTPGIRRISSLKKDPLEKFSILRSKKAISRSDMVLLVFDGSEEFNELDERIAGIIHKANIPSIVVINKWDLMEDKSDFGRRKLENTFRSKFKFLSWSPIVVISALQRNKLNDIFKEIQNIDSELKKKIPEYLLNDFLRRVSLLFSVPHISGRKIKLFSISQINGQVPTFLILCNDPNLLHFSYARLVENQLRNCFKYTITPITVIYKKTKNK